MNSSNVSSGSNTEPKRKRSYNNQNHHHKVKSHCLVIDACAEKLVEDEKIVPDAENRPFYRDMLTSVFKRSITIDAAKKKAKDDNIRKRLEKLIRESKKMLVKALGGAPEDIPPKTREMVGLQQIDQDELWPSHSKSVFPKAARQPKKAVRFEQTVPEADAADADLVSEASKDLRIKTLEDENRRLKAQLERSEDARRDAEVKADGYGQRLKKLEDQYKQAPINANGKDTDVMPSTSAKMRERPGAEDEQVEEIPAKRRAVFTVEEHLRRKLHDVIGEYKQEVSELQPGSVPEIDYWKRKLEPEDLAELAAWTNGSPYERFKNKKKLGKGGQGTVYRVDFQQQYAVKEVILSSAYKLQQLLKEAKASYKLRHNNLLSCLFRYFDGKKAYLVTQLMDKGDLEEIVKQIKGNLPEAAAAYVVRELLEVLHFLHKDAKTAHRDVKPANILATSTGEVKLADFGLCGDLTEPRETGLGTPFFLWPEMVIAVQNGANEHDLKVDTWAVGVTLFYLLTKQFPFNSPNVNAIYNKILKNDPIEACRRAVQAARTKVTLSDECWAFLERCLVKDKDQRADTAELLASSFVKTASLDAWKAVVAPATE